MAYQEDHPKSNANSYSCNGWSALKVLAGLSPKTCVAKLGDNGKEAGIGFRAKVSIRFEQTAFVVSLGTITAAVLAACESSN